jgi:hypothetical protein
LTSFINSNALSLKLTANPHWRTGLVPDRKHLYQGFYRQRSAGEKTCPRRAFQLYQTWLAEPLSAAAKNQFHPCSAGSEATSSQNGCGRKKRFSFPYPVLNAGNIVEELRHLCQKHPASHHPLLIFSSSASATQIDYFFKSDSALNLLFSIWSRWGWSVPCQKRAQKLPRICGMR